MQAGAFHDNLVAAVPGRAPVREMTDAQRRLLLAVAESYVDWRADGHAEVRGGRGRSATSTRRGSRGTAATTTTRPFYYRVHSPVILIEFDHHPGVVLDNEEPTRDPRPHRGAHAERRRLRRRPPPPAPRAVRPPPRRPPPALNAAHGIGYSSALSTHPGVRRSRAGAVRTRRSASGACRRPTGWCAPAGEG